MRNGSASQGAVVEAMESRLFLDATQLSEIVTSSTVTHTSTLRAVAGKAVVTVQNPGDALKGALGVSIYASQTPLNPSTGPVDGNYFLGIKTLNGFKAGTTGTVTIPLKAKAGALPEGTYTLYAVAADKLVASVATSGPTFTVTPPSIALAPTEVFSKLPTTIQAGDKTPAVDKVTILNNGEDIASGKVTIDVFASGNGSAAGATLITTLTRTMKIGAGKKATLSLPLKSIPPELAPATYQLITQVTDPVGINTVGSSAATLTVTGAPAASFDASVTSAKVKRVVVKSTGNSDQTVTVGLAFKNTGSAAIAGEALTLSVYRSSSPTTAEHLIGTGSYTLSVGKGGTRKAAIAVSEEVAPHSDGFETEDQYIVVAVSDATGVLQLIASSKKVNVDV